MTHGNRVLTYGQIQLIKSLYYRKQLDLRTFVDPVTKTYVPGIQHLPLRKVVRQYFGLDIDSFYENSVLEAARIVSANLRNRRGRYAPITVGVRIRDKGYVFKNGRLLKKTVHEENRDIVYPEEIANMTQPQIC